MLLSKIVELIGLKCDVYRDADFDLLEQCTRIRGTNALTYLEKEKFIFSLNNEDITCVICPDSLLERIPSTIKGIIVSNNPKYVFFKIHNYMADNLPKISNVIDSSACIDPTAYIAPYNVIIGPNVVIGPNAVIHENTTIEEDVKINSNTVVGGQSFTSVPDGSGALFLAHDGGCTIIRKGVEICSNCHIARGTLLKDITELGEYTKLDAMVHVGHGTVIGKRTLIPAGAMISGNCVIGNDVWIGVNATVSNRIEIGDHGRVSLGSVVTKNVADGETVTGNFAIKHDKFIENLKKNR